MKNMIAVILAAGRGTRMKSGTPKVLHSILGRPMISYVTGAVSRAGVKDIVVVTGFGSGKVKDFFYGTRVKTVVQKRLSGSADAVSAAKKEIKGYSDVLVVYGDTPLITEGTLKSLIERHKSSGASLTLLTAVLKDPAGYGRIIRDTGGKITKIAEDGELREYKKETREINVGTCVFARGGLLDALKDIGRDNSKREYYLTDAVRILSARALKVESIAMENSDEMIGINSRIELAAAVNIMKNRIMEELMASGVTIQDPATTTIYPDVKIGKDTVIYPNTIIESGVRIGSDCHIGPFARLRGGTRIGDKAEIGNFVELVRTVVADSTKIKHHTYLGDAKVGRFVNIGAGTITANYDGKNKSSTFIGDSSFIGVGAILIAPVKIGKRALVGAGAVILRGQNVKDGATVVGVPAKVLRRRVGDRRKTSR
ncbi:MAG: NTP transferase domain-containing protein [Candidatus Omnitrophica bacterium]|nr:NTP transferase domain-containing protein [Candidatus Omnitrophota bacterium]